MTGDGKQSTTPDDTRKTKEVTTSTTVTKPTTPKLPEPVAKKEGEEGGALRDSVQKQGGDSAHNNEPAALVAFLCGLITDGGQVSGDGDAGKDGKGKEGKEDQAQSARIDKNVPAENAIGNALKKSGLEAEAGQVRERMKEQVALDIKNGVLKPGDLDQPPTIGSALVGTGALSAEELIEARRVRNERADKEKNPDLKLMDVLRDLYKDKPEQLAKIEKAGKFFEAMLVEAKLKAPGDRTDVKEAPQGEEKKRIDEKVEKYVPSEDQIKKAQAAFGLEGDPAQFRKGLKEETARELKDGTLKEAALDKPVDLQPVLVASGALTADELKAAVKDRDERAAKAKADGKPEPTLLDVLKDKYKGDPERLEKIDKAVNLHDAMIGEIAFDKLPLPKQKEVLALRTLQGSLIKLSSEKGLFANPQERKEFIEKLQGEMSKVKPGGDGKGLVFEKLPEFGKTTQEGYERLVRYLEAKDGGIARRYANINALELKDVPDFPVTAFDRGKTNEGALVGRDLGVLKSRDQILQELQKGNVTLKIDTGDIKDVDRFQSDVGKLVKLQGWMGDIDKSVHDEIIERKSVVLSRMLERGIADGRYPPGWRRPEGMDKETWCAALEQTMNTYRRFNGIVEALNHVKRADVGFKTDAFDNFPNPQNIQGKKGISVDYDEKDRATNVSYGDFMVTDIRLLSDKNNPILAELNNWSDRYEADGKKALFDLLRAQGKPTADGYNPVPHDAIGYGKTEIKQGFVNPDKHAWTSGDTRPPGEGWKHFNLLTYDMSIKNQYDKFGKVEKVLITPDTRYHEVPPGPLGYCNFVKFAVHSENDQKPLEYLPNQYATVQTGPQQCEMVLAKDAADWKALQELKEFASTAVTVTMDGAMVASGGLTCLGAREIAKMGLKEAVVEGAEYLSTRAMTKIPGEIVKRQVAKGLFEIGLGLGGPLTHGAGSQEIPVLKAAGDLRTAWFIAHGAYGMAGWFKLPEAGEALLKAASPRTAKSLEGLVSTIRGSKETQEAMQLAHTGALHHMGEGWLGAEKMVHRAFSWSESAFIGQFAWDSSHMYKEYQKHLRPWAFEQAQKSFIQADLTDPTAVRKLIEQGPGKQEILDLHMRDYKKALGPLSKESSDTIDGIMAKVKELSGPDATDEQRKAYLTELMKHFRYSGEQITDMRKEGTDKYIKEHPYRHPEDADDRKKASARKEYLDRVKGFEPHSEADYIKMAQEDTSAFDPKVRKMAALAMLVLARDEKGYEPGSDKGPWPEVLATRQVTAPGFSVEVPQDPGDGKPADTVQKDAVQGLKQEVTLTEAYDLVSMDLHRETDMQTRIQKAGVLSETGLIARNHYASLLMTQLDGSQPATKEQQLHALVELGRTINKLDVEEYARQTTMAEQDQYAARGMTAGLTATDLKTRLAELLPNMKDEEVKATTQFTLDFLNKPHLDAVDRQRFNDVFFKEKSGISKEVYHKQLVDDMASEPKDVGGWERKLSATRHLLDEAITGGDARLATDVYKSLKSCAETCPYSGVKVGAVEALLSKGDKGEPAKIEAIADLIKNGPKVDGKDPPDVKKEFLTLCALNMFDLPGIKDDANLSPVDRSEAARGREHLIAAVTPYVQVMERGVVRAGFEGTLSSLVNRKAGTADPYAEVRVAALKALGSLQVGNKQYLDIVKACLDPNIETSGAVRLESIGTAEKMVLNSKQLRELLGPLATRDPDIAVQSRLARYYRPEGNLGDATSPKSKQKVVDITAEHDKPDIDDTERQRWLKQFHPNLLFNDNIMGYFNADALNYKGFRTIPGGEEGKYTVKFSTEWAWAKGDAEHTGLFGLNDYWDDLKAKSGRQHLIQLEAIAQVEAYKAYRSGVESLADQALNGKGDVVLQSGDKEHKVSKQEAAIYALGALMSGPERMGEAFYKHRKSYNIDNPGGYQDFSQSEQSERQGYITKPNYWLQIYKTDFDKNGIAPFTSNPWPRMELEIANKFKDLADTCPTGLPVLKNQIIAGLESKNIQNDKAKVVLVEALDKMVSRDNVHPSVVQDAVRRVAKIVAETKDVQQEGGKQLKTESMIAMIDFLNKHGIKKGPNDKTAAFEPYSDDANAIRLAINSRMREASASTSVPVRIRANELYERQWQSVLDMTDHREALSNVDVKDKAKTLPTDLTMLEKDFLRNKLSDSRESVDEIVNSNVQLIVDATKGDTLKEGDPRLETLVKLTDEKYHERIRMAAALALVNSQTESSTGINTLQKIALNSDTAAYRHDAIRALERLGRKTEMISDGELQPARDRMIARLTDVYSKTPESERKKMKIEAVSEEQLKGKSNADLVKLAQDYISKVDPNNAQFKYQAFELRQSLYEFGSSLTNIGIMHMNSGPERYGQAEQNLKDGLAAFGVDAGKFADLKKPFQTSSWAKHQPLQEWERNNPNSIYSKTADQLTADLLKIEIYDDVKKTDGNLELHTQELPSLILALNKYAQLNAAMNRVPGAKMEVDRIDTALACASLSEVLTKQAYPDGVGLAGDSYAQIANAYRSLAETRITSNKGATDWTPYFYKPAVELYKKAEADFNKQKILDPSNQRPDIARVALKNELLSMQLANLSHETKKLEGKTGVSLKWGREGLDKLSNELDKEFESYPQKDSADYHFKKCFKHMVDARRQEDDDKKKPFYENAQKEILEAIKVSGTQYGVTSPAYNSCVNRLIELAKEAKRPEMAENFLKEGLDKAGTTRDDDLKMVMLRQYANFLHSQGREDEKSQVLQDYNMLWVKNALKRSGGEISPELERSITTVRDQSKARAEAALKGNDFGRADKLLNDFVEMDKALNKGKVSEESKPWLTTVANRAEGRAATQLKAGQYKDVQEPFAAFIDAHRALNDDKLPQNILDKLDWMSRTSTQLADQTLPESDSFDKGKFEKIEPLLKIALQAQEAQVKFVQPGDGADNSARLYAATAQRLANGYAQSGKMPEAEATLKKAVDTTRVAPSSPEAVINLVNFYAKEPGKITETVNSYMDSLLASGRTNEDITKAVDSLIELTGPTALGMKPPGVVSNVVTSVIDKIDKHARKLPEAKRNEFLAGVGPGIATVIQKRADELNYMGLQGKTSDGQDLPKETSEAFKKEAGELETKRHLFNSRVEPALVKTYNKADLEGKTDHLLNLMQLYAQEKMDDAIAKLGKYHFGTMMQAGDTEKMLEVLTSVNSQLSQTGREAAAAKLTMQVAEMIRQDSTKVGDAEKEARLAKTYPGLVEALAGRQKALNDSKDPEAKETIEGLKKLIKDLSADSLGAQKKQTEKMLKDNPEAVETTKAATRLAMMYAYQGNSAAVKDLASSYLTARMEKSSAAEALYGLGEMCDALASNPDTQMLAVDICKDTIKALEAKAPKDGVAENAAARKQYYEALHRFIDYRISMRNGSSEGNASDPVVKALEGERERLKKIAFQ